MHSRQIIAQGIITMHAITLTHSLLPFFFAIHLPQEEEEQGEKQAYADRSEHCSYHR